MLRLLILWDDLMFGIKSTIDLITLGGNAEVVAFAIDLANIEAAPGSISQLKGGISCAPKLSRVLIGKHPP